MMAPDLPEELLEEILCRVPAASLKKLQSTCKQWNRLFNETRFKRKHFDKAAKQLLLLTLTEESRVCLLNVNLYNGTPCTEVTGELNLDQVNIDKVSHCDGLLLCTIKNEARIVVWNPCTGQTKWIQPGKNDCCNCSHNKFVLGYSQDKKSCDKSYKILSYNYECDNQLEFKLYDINSNSWRNLDVTLIPDHLYSSYNHKVSFKGKTYWFAPADSKADHLCLISFDYSSESFERLRLPYDQSISYRNASLSVVGEEKLSMLLQRENTSRREIWVTKKVDDDETKEMSWSKLLEVEVGIRRDMMFGSFLVDEEKKIVVCCEQRDVESKSIITVSFVGEDSNVPQEGFFPVKTVSSSKPFFVDYVPSLIQLPPSFIMFIRASS